MTGRFRFLASLVAILLGALPAAAEPALLEPPFGLHWGDSPEKLLAWASRQALDVTISLPADQPGLRIVRVQPRRGLLPDGKAGAVEGRFLTGKLYEVTIHYFDREATAEMIEARFDELRRQLVAAHGPLLANRQQRLVDDQFVTRTQSFHREPVKGLFLLLAYTEVEDLLRKTREARFSLIYRNDNYQQELLESAPKP